MDNANRKTLTLLPEHSYCKLRDIPDGFDPEDTFSTLSVMEYLHPVVTPEASQIRKLTEVTMGPATPEEVASK